MKKIINKFKRGFTIVELVIVIAVIAILAAVLIPTLSNVLNSAEESADMQTVYHLNQILSSYSTVGDGAETISEAIEQADENGYNVSKLTPTSDGDILWDSESNRFLLVSSSGEVLYSDSTTKIDEITSGTIYPNLWKIVSSSSEVTSYYSIYYSANYSETLTTLAISNVGVDVSAYTANTVNISYTGDNGTASADTIVINGNGGTLTLNDTNVIDDIKFYGIASTVTATSVASASLHIHGAVTGNVYMAKGHVVIESGSSVTSVYASSSEVSITNSSTNTISVSKASGVTVETSGNISAENIRTAEELSYFAGGFGTEASPYQISTAAQFANISNVAGYGNTTVYYFVLNNDITFGSSDLSYYSCYYTCTYLCGAVLDGQNYTITIGESAPDFTMVFWNAANATIKNLNVNFQNNKEDSILYYSSGNVIFDTVTTKGYLSDTGNDGAYVIYNECENLTFKNCINEATIIDRNSSSYNAVFVGQIPNYVDYASSITFENCENKGTFTGCEAAIFVANKCSQGSLSLTINNCKNSASVRTTSTTGEMDSDTNAYKKITNSSNGTKDLISQILCRQNGNLSITIDGNEVNYYDTFFNNFYIGPDDVINITLNEDGTFTFTKSKYSNVDHYVVSIKTYTRITAGGTWTYSISEEITSDGSESYTTALQNLALTMDTTATVSSTITSITEEGNKVTVKIVDIDGVSYYLYEPDEVNRAGTTVSEGQKFTLYIVSAYDSDGNLISSAIAS